VRAGSFEFNGIALGSFGAIAVYHLLRRLSPPAGETVPQEG
jgi:hypothetical protein